VTVISDLSISSSLAIQAITGVDSIVSNEDIENFNAGKPLMS
jgi:hypothetical protein